jgi:cold-inducible RNA-binding protein
MILYLARILILCRQNFTRQGILCLLGSAALFRKASEYQLNNYTSGVARSQQFSSVCQRPLPHLKEKKMAHKLFVGGLPYSTTDDQLRELFEAIGEVESAQVIVDRDTNRSTGFGFVTMVADDDAQKAISELDGKDFEGRRLAVNEARPKEPRSGGFGGGQGGQRRDRDNNFGGGRRY